METTKKKKGPVIAVIIICVLLVLALLGGAAAYWFCFRPIVKVNKAIEEEDYREVSDLFDKLNSEEKEEVTEKMSDLADDLRHDYEKEKADYDDVMDIYDILEEKVLEDDKNLEKNIEKIEALKESREAYAEGRSAMDKEDYQAAIEAFGKVIEKDSNYDSAQELIAECQELLPADVVGNWVCNYNIAEVIATYLDLGGTTIPDIKVPFYCDFYENNTGKVYMNTEDMMDAMDGLIDVLLPILVKQFADEYGMTEKELDSMLGMVYGKSMREYLKDEINKELADSLEGSESEFTYEVTADGIIAKDNTGSEILFSIDGEELLMTTDDSSAIEALEEIGMKLPLRFERVMY